MINKFKDFFRERKKTVEEQEESRGIEVNDVVHIKWLECDVINNAIGRIIYIAEDESYIIIDLIGLTDYENLTEEMKMFRSKFQHRVETESIKQIARIFLWF